MGMVDYGRMRVYLCISTTKPYPRPIHQLECLISLTRVVSRLLTADDLSMQHSVPDALGTFCPIAADSDRKSVV